MPARQFERRIACRYFIQDGSAFDVFEPKILDSQNCEHVLKVRLPTDACASGLSFSWTVVLGRASSVKQSGLF